MTKTALSVARNCGMVGPNDHVIIVNGFAPDKDGPARLEWERAEMPREESSEYSDQEVGIIAPDNGLFFINKKVIIVF